MVELPASRTSETAEAASLKRAPHDLRLIPNEDPLSLNDRIYQRIRELIVSGSFEYGSRIASSRQLARSLRVSRSSILNAIDRLVADGFLQPRRGSGVYVAYRGPHRERDPLLNKRPQQTVALPFAIGTAAVDLFPTQMWAKLQSRRWQQSSDLLLQEGEAAGWIGLREAIATYVASRRGLLCAPEQVFVSACIPLLIENAMHALNLDGSECWIEDPFYEWSVSKLRDSKFRPASSRAEESEMDVVVRWQDTAPEARAILVAPSCQFPTGEALSPTRRTELLRWAETEDVWIFEDDFDWQMVNDARMPPLAGQAPKRTIYFDTFNHILFPALGIAYAIVPPSLIDRFEKAQRGTVTNANAVNQMVLTDFINSGHLDRHVAVLQGAGEERRATLNRALAKDLSDFLRAEPGDAGSHVVCRCEGIAAGDVVHAAETEGIAITNTADLGLRADCHDRILLGFRSFAPHLIEGAAVALRKVLLNLPRRLYGASPEAPPIADVHAVWSRSSAFHPVPY